MVAILNIRRDVEDPFYRYKMPELLCKIEGRGNGIKTVFPNMADVAKALCRPATYPTKFFGYELGAQTSFSNDKFVVQGAHEASAMAKLLDDFIVRFVLCPSCLNPETELVISGSAKQRSIRRECKACGAKTDVPKNWKLTTFIVNNPPPKAHGQYDKGKAAVAGSDEAQRNEDDSTPNSPPTEANAINIGGSDDELGASVAEIALGPDAYELFGTWCEENRDTATPAEIQAKAEELEVDGKYRTAQVAIQTLLDENAIKNIPRLAPALRSFVTSEKALKALLGGLEILTVEHPTLLPNTSTLLMALYQTDVFDQVDDSDEMLVHWSKHISKKYVDKEESKAVRVHAVRFFTWLEDAEEDDSEEEE